MGRTPAAGDLYSSVAGRSSLRPYCICATFSTLNICRSVLRSRNSFRIFLTVTHNSTYSTLRANVYSITDSILNFDSHFIHFLLVHTRNKDERLRQTFLTRLFIKKKPYIDNIVKHNCLQYRLSVDWLVASKIFAPRNRSSFNERQKWKISPLWFICFATKKLFTFNVHNWNSTIYHFTVHTFFPLNIFYRTDRGAIQEDIQTTVTRCMIY